MARVDVLFGLLLLVFCDVVVSDIFDILNNVEPCVAACDKTYPLHTYPNFKHSGCCRRGCRFFTLVQAVDVGDDLNATKDACQASCMEAYSHTNERYACNIGCSNMASISGKSRKDFQMKDPMDPFSLMQSMYSGMLDRLQNMLNVGWTVYVEDGDSVLVMRSEGEADLMPEIMPSIQPQLLPQNDGEPEDLLTDPALLRQLEDSSGRLPEKHVKTLPDVEPPQRAGEMVSVTQLDWLGCVSRKSGLPRWLLAATIFLSVMIIMWLCFATTPEHSQYKQLGGMEYLHTAVLECPVDGELDGKVPLDPSQAPPLPLKLNIDKV